MSRLPLLLCLPLLLTAASASSRTWYITPDGTGDAPTIKAAIDSAVAGDTVLVACGTYYEYDIRMKSGVVLVSESGKADCVTIDAEHMNRVFICDSCDSTTVIKGFTITNGMPAIPMPGSPAGGMLCGWGSSLEIVNCNFVNNWASGYGGGVYCQYSSPRFINCTFAGNEASYGGGLCLEVASPTLENCTFLENESGYGGGLCSAAGSAPTLVNCTFYRNYAKYGGGGIYCMEWSSPVIENTIIAYSTSGSAVMCEDEISDPTLSCCDVFGNHGGDWVGCIADQLGVRGNFSACPSFCHAETGDLRLCDQSPCLPGNHPHGYDCGLIGAWGEGCSCGPSKGEPATWGSIKAIYR